MLLMEHLVLTYSKLFLFLLLNCLEERGFYERRGLEEDWTQIEWIVVFLFSEVEYGIDDIVLY
jgi:hypothetical protein